MASDEVFKSEVDYRRKLAALKAAVTLGTARETRNRWKAFYERDHQTHTPGRTFATEYAARQWLRDEQHLIDSGAWTPPAIRRAQLAAEEEVNALTFADYASRWIGARVTRHGRPLHPRTVAEYRAYVAGILEPIATKKLVKVTLADWKRWHADNAHRPVLRHRSYAFAKSVFASAVADELIARTPCRVENATRKPPATADRDKLIRGIDHDKIAELATLVPPRDRMLILLEAYCCVRTGEACALRRSDVETGIQGGMPFGWLAVERGVSLYDGQRHEGDVKTGRGGERIVPIPPHLVADLEQHLAVWAQPGPRGLLFPSTTPTIEFRTSAQIAGWPEEVRPDGRIYDTPGARCCMRS